MISHCLFCEDTIRIISVPVIGYEATCPTCFDPAEDGGERSCMRGFGEDKRDAAEDLLRVQREWLDDNAGETLVANLYEELQAQIQAERAAQLATPIRFEIGGESTTIPRTAMELARWAAKGGA